MIAILLGVAAAACTVVSGVTAHLPAGEARGQTGVWDGERIVAVGVGAPDVRLVLDAQQKVTGASYRGEACAFVQGAGRHLTAGIIAVDTQLGVLDIDLEPAANHADPLTPDSVRAALWIADAYDPLSVVIPTQRAGGITGAVVTPRGGDLVVGQAAWVRLTGTHRADAVVRRDVALLMELPSPSTAEAARRWRELFADVRLWATDPKAFDAGRTRSLTDDLSASDLAALLPYARRERPIVVGADKAATIELALELARELDLSIVVRGGAEAWLLADRLAAERVPVLLDPLLHGVEGFEALRAHEANAARLAAAGVTVVFTTADAIHNARLVRHHAGHAVRAGMPPAAALAAITHAPAQLFGIPDRGRVDVGAIADRGLWSGDPCEVTSLAEAVWIDGVPVPLQSRQSELRDRYLERLGLGR